MITWKMTTLALALSMDAAIAAFAFGLLGEQDHFKNNIFKSFILALLFGFFQFFLSWIGGSFGLWFIFTEVGHSLNMMIFFIFFFLGIKCVRDSFVENDLLVDWSLMTLLMAALGTSLDAFLAGISLHTVPFFEITTLWIGLVTFVMSLLFYGIGLRLIRIPEKWLLRMAGVIFGFLAVRSLNL